MTQDKTFTEDTVAKGLLMALDEDEAALAIAYEDYAAASSTYDIASRRFAAMREAVRERLGTSPYSKNVEWPVYTPDGEIVRPDSKFRYIRMKVGDAITEVLSESDDPLTLVDIVAALNYGGLFVRDTRTVNAALINTKGVKKIGEGIYTYERLC